MHRGTGREIQVLGADQVVVPFVGDLLRQAAQFAAGELQGARRLAGGEPAVQGAGNGEDEGATTLAVAVEVRGCVAEDARGRAHPAAAVIRAFVTQPVGGHPAELGAGVGDHVAGRLVVAEQAAADGRGRDIQAQVVEHRGGEVHQAVAAVLDPRQLLLLGREHDAQPPAAHPVGQVAAVGLVRGDDHQGVLEHPVPAQAVDEGGHGAVHLGHGGDLA